MPAGEKALDHKLVRIRAGQYVPADFIIADAKDADMGFGAGAPGPVYNDNNQPTDRVHRYELPEDWSLVPSRATP